MMISKNWNCFTIGFNPEYETWNALRKKLFIKAEKGKDRLSFVSYKCSILRDPVNNKMLSFLPSYYVKKKWIEEDFFVQSEIKRVWGERKNHKIKKAPSP